MSFGFLWLMAGPGRASPPPSDLASAQVQGQGFADLVDHVGDTAVYIQVDKGLVVASGIEQLVRDLSLPQPDRGFGWATSGGSGVVVRADGLVLTNHHVVSGATGILVTLRDRRTYPAKVVGTDARRDLAVLRIQSDETFQAAALGDSSTVRVGEWVVAIGHPFDFQFSVTAGIVSALGRRDPASDEIQSYIQTDASVNPGSSGGPLFNLKGEVIGINTAIFTPAAGAVQNAGISFAIPSNMAASVMQDLLVTGTVGQPGLGVVAEDRPSGPEHPRAGALVQRVVPRSPAEAAGLVPGDVVLAVDEEPVAGVADLRALVLSRGVGVHVALVVERGPQLLHLEVVTWDESQLGGAGPALPADAPRWAGMTLLEPTPQNLATFGVTAPADEGGVLVGHVDLASPAALAGIVPGDLLLEVQRRSARDVEHLLRLVDGRSSAFVTFWRSGGRSYAAIAGAEPAAE